MYTNTNIDIHIESVYAAQRKWTLPYDLVEMECYKFRWTVHEYQFIEWLTFSPTNPFRSVSVLFPFSFRFIDLRMQSMDISVPTQFHTRKLTQFPHAIGISSNANDILLAYQQAGTVITQKIIITTWLLQTETLSKCDTNFSCSNFSFCSPTIRNQIGLLVWNLSLSQIYFWHKQIIYKSDWRTKFFFFFSFFNRIESQYEWNAFELYWK